MGYYVFKTCNLKKREILKHTECIIISRLI